MANFDQLKQSVAALIRTNGAEEITGQIMQDVLLTIINSISGGYMFGGVAQHSGNVGNPDYNVFYLAGSGAYTGYGDAINIPNGCYGVFRYNGSWTQDVVDIGVHLTGTIREGETNGVTGDVINTALQQLFNNVMNILDTLTFTYNTPSAQQATKAMLDVIVTPTGGASHVLTTLTLVSATAAAAGLMSAEDKQKVDRMLTDFRSLSFSDTTAVADQATKIVQTLSATLGENPEAITTMTFFAATAAKAGLLSAADKAKLDSLWSSGYQFAGIATPSTTPVNTTSKIFYIATEAGTYFNAVTVTKGINILSWNGTSWSAVQVVGIDDEPTAGSSNLVESKSVKDTPWVRPENTNFMYRKNIFEGTWEYGGLITASTNQGDEFESDEICRTDFMPVKPSTNYVFMGFRDAAARVYDAMYAFFYNTEKECVGMVAAYEGATVPTTSDTAYIRIRTRDGHCPSAATQEVIRMTMLEGTVPATEYTPSDVAFSSKIVLPEYDEVIEEVDASSYENTLNLSKNVNYISERTGNYSSSHWSSLGSHMIIPLDDVSVVVIASNSSLPSSYAFIKGYSNNGIVFCTGVINTTDLAAGSMTRISASSVPSDAKYLYVRCIDSLERDCTPRIIDINGINYVESKANKQALQIKNIPFVVGIYNSSGGIYTNNDTYNGIVGTYVRTKDVLFVKAGSFINGSYYMTILKYNSSDMDDIASVTYQGATTGYVFNNDGYYTITLRKSDYSKLLPETIDIISTIYTTKDYNYVESAFIGGSGYYNAGGDCTLFQTPNAKNVIIDFSNFGPMSGAVKKALYYRGVFRVDAAVVSHYHSDHTQGLCYALVNKVLDFTHCTFYLPDDTSMQYVIDNMGEGERFYGDYDTSSHETYVLINSYFDAEPDQEGNVTLTWNGSTYTVPQFQGTVVYPDHDGQTAIIDGLEIVFWNTDHSVYTSSGNGTYNEFSLCCDVLFGQKRICMTGDIGPVGEEQIQNHMKKANILKAQHHGWENSVMNSDFICRVYPEIVVTEDSREHDMLIYRETSPLQSWCEKNGVPNYRTRTNGVMDFVITDKSISATSVMKNFVRGGIDWCLTYGDSANRPKSCRPGMQYFDTTIGKPIYWCVNDNHPSGAWVDSTGEAV